MYELLFSQFWRCNKFNSIQKLTALVTVGDREVRYEKYELHSSQYHIIGVDLRKESEVDTKLRVCGIQGSIPTVFVSECVLVYVDAKASENLLMYLGRTFETAVFINYEQANMNDNFGEVMLKNLDLRGCQLCGVSHCISLDTQIQRFTNTGWNRSYGWIMSDVYNKLPHEELSRIEKIEMLDEKILLKQLLDHYCIVISLRFASNTCLEGIDVE